MKIFYKAVPRVGGIDLSDTKFSVWRLAKALDRIPLNRILLRIADLGPVTSVSAAHLRHFLANPKAAEAVGDFLSDPKRNTSPYLESWLFAAILEHPTRTPETWSHRARAVAFDRNAASYHRVLAVNVLALDAKASDLDQIRRVIVQENDPEIVRGALVALARVGKLDTASTASARAMHPDLEVALRYLKDRRGLPSLVTAAAPFRSVPNQERWGGSNAGRASGRRVSTSTRQQRDESQTTIRTSKESSEP